MAGMDEVMGRFTASGVELTPEVIDALVSEAERGYDAFEMRVQFVGQPRHGEDPDVRRLTFRAPVDLVAAAQKRADEEGRAISDLAAESLREYLKG
jgi:hypothetical protein